MSAQEEIAPSVIQPESPIVRELEVANVEVLQDFIERMNRRAKKLGLPPVALEILERTVKKQRLVRGDVDPQLTIHEPVEVGVEVCRVRVSAQPLKLPGNWQLAARLDFEEGGTIVSAVPGVEIPSHFRTSDCICEHCKTKRRRAHTYVVRNVKEERHVQVGSDCISDFLGHESPAAIAAQLEFMSTLIVGLGGFGDPDQEPGERGSRAPRYWDAKGLLSVACASVREHGYISVGASKDALAAGNFTPSTKDRVLTHLHGVRKEDFITSTDEDDARAEKILRWVREEVAAVPAEQRQNEYMNNIAVALGGEFVRDRFVGIAVSAIPTYDREMGIRVAREGRSKTSRHVGVKGERADFGFRVRQTKSIIGAYGTSTICIFEDEAGNEFKWFATGSPPAFSPGDHVLLKATVVKHEEYKGVRQTVINRCKPIDKIKVIPTAHPAPSDIPATAAKDVSRQMTEPAFPHFCPPMVPELRDQPRPEQSGCVQEV